VFPHIQSRAVVLVFSENGTAQSGISVFPTKNFGSGFLRGMWYFRTLAMVLICGFPQVSVSRTLVTGLIYVFARQSVSQAFNCTLNDFSSFFTYHKQPLELQFPVITITFADTNLIVDGSYFFQSGFSSRLRKDEFKFFPSYGSFFELVSLHTP
jgi:hypothetical protein